MKLPETMNCIEIPEPGGPEALKTTTRPVPTPAPSEVLIRVEVAGINRPDCIQRQGNYAPPPGTTDIPGLEVSGEIVAVGVDIKNWSVGDKVAALVAGGGYAEYVAAPFQQCLPIPNGLSMIEAAALPEAFFTVWTNVFERGALKKGETLMIHGGSSGIGTTAIQIASDPWDKYERITSLPRKPAVGQGLFYLPRRCGNIPGCQKHGATPDERQNQQDR